MLWLSMQLEYVFEQLVRTFNRFCAVKSTAEILFELADSFSRSNWQLSNWQWIGRQLQLGQCFSGDRITSYSSPGTTEPTDRPSLCYKCRLCKRFCALTLVESSVRVVLFFTVALWFIQYRINLCWRGNSYGIWVLWFVHASLGRQACPTRDRSRVWYRINLCKQATQRNCSKNIVNS